MRLCICLAVLAVARLSWGQIVPIGPEFQVNTTTASNQGGPDVVADPAGQFVITWTSLGQDGSNAGVFGQRFDSSGNPLGGEFQVNSFTPSGQLRPRMSSDAAGNFVVAWMSDLQDGDSIGIFAQRYDSAGTPVAGEFQVNTFTGGPQQAGRAAMDDAGNFLVVWHSEHEGDGSGIFGQLYDSAGAAIGGEFQVNSYTPSYQRLPAAAADPAGNFLVVWESRDQDGDDYGIFGQRYDGIGTALGGEFQVSTTTTNRQTQPHAACAATGDCVVVWQSRQVGFTDEVMAQRYDAAGNRIRGEFQLNVLADLEQANPRAALFDDGTLIVVWSSDEQDGDGRGIFVRAFDPADAPLTGDVQVNTFTTGDQYEPVVATSPGGRFVASWVSLDQDGAGEGVFAQRFELTTAAPYNIYRSASPIGLIAPANLLDTTMGTSYSDLTPPAAPVLYYAVDDGVGSTVIKLVKPGAGTGVSIVW